MASGRNNPYNFKDEEGNAAIWIHYFDTKQNYMAKGFSREQAKTIAAGAIEPDLYRYRNIPGVRTFIATPLGLDLKMDN